MALHRVSRFPVTTLRKSKKPIYPSRLISMLYTGSLPRKENERGMT